MSKGTLGIAVVGLGGAVGTTMVAGIELLKKGLIETEGLPLAGICDSLAAYDEIVFAGWDLNDANLAEAAAEHGVLSHKQFVQCEAALSRIFPWQAFGNTDFLANIEGLNMNASGSHEDSVTAIREQLREFGAGCGSAVVINLASTEKIVDLDDDCFASIDSFESAISENSPSVSPAMLYAYAAILEEIPYGNFTPSAAADIPGLIQLAEKKGVPVAGKDGKTGQTFIKTVLAPALKARALQVEGWYSTNLLGNRDGLALSDEDSLASKVKTKQSVLKSILGYEVEDHNVDIRYYKPRGDNKKRSEE